VAVLRQNLVLARVSERGHVIGGVVGRWRPPAGSVYTLVVADPSYDDSSAWDAIGATLNGALATHAMVAVEHSARVPAPEHLVPLDWTMWKDRRQGDGAVAIYRNTGWESA